MSQTEIEKTENLTINIKGIPCELMDHLWKSMDKMTTEKYNQSIEKTGKMEFDFYEISDHSIAKLIGNAITLYFTQFIQNNTNK